MCGVLGQFIFDRSGAVDGDLLARMADTITHRGPDDVGYFVKGNVGLGHRRLSIIDLYAAGHQPMTNEDGTVWIFYNGEIYNFQSVRRELVDRGHQFRSQTDSEVIIHRYE